MILNHFYSPEQNYTAVIQCCFGSEVADPTAHEIVSLLAHVGLYLATCVVVGLEYEDAHRLPARETWRKVEKKHFLSTYGS